MIPGISNNDSIKTTSHKVVVPFYIYAAFSLLISCVMLLLSSSNFLGHYFQPKILAITHMMALGWGTMMILGASHQLVPVLIEGKLHSEKLAHASFYLGAIGVPLMVYSFYFWDMGHPAKWGGRFILLSILCYIINLNKSIKHSKSKNNIHAIFILTSVIWLFITAFLGLALVYNFTFKLFNHDSIYYLPLHVHAGIIGWFLMLIIGVGSRLIPMFLISKYENKSLLKWIYFLINGSLISYIILFYISNKPLYAYLSWILLFIGIIMFVYYCIQAYKDRIRKKVDEQMKISILAIFMILVPILLLFICISTISLLSKEYISLSLSYGFLILFGWITAIILGMTFKTLPFIIWKKVYTQNAFASKTPSPKDLFNNQVFILMSIVYLLGLIAFVIGILTKDINLINIGAILLIFTSILYVFNVIKVIFHKAKTS